MTKAAKVQWHPSYLDLVSRSRESLATMLGESRQPSIHNVVSTVCESVENLIPSQWMQLLSEFVQLSDEQVEAGGEVVDIMKIVFPKPVGSQGPLGPLQLPRPLTPMMKQMPWTPSKFMMNLWRHLCQSGHSIYGTSSSTLWATLMFQHSWTTQRKQSLGPRPPRAQLQEKKSCSGPP